MAFTKEIKIFLLVHVLSLIAFLFLYVRFYDYNRVVFLFAMVGESLKLAFIIYYFMRRVVELKKAVPLAEQRMAQRLQANMAEMNDKEAQLAALQSQINPHFLYNTLESIRGQALMDGNADVAKMVEVLSSFFRYSISRSGQPVTLREELANIHNYMTIQRYRFNNRFSLDVFIDEDDEIALDYQIPKLIIQPVVENAIFHGLEEHMDGGKVMIEVIVTEKNLIITISDNGKGIDVEALERLNEKILTQGQLSEDSTEGKQRNTGIGLLNIHKRLQLLYGAGYGVHVYSTLNQGTDVEITIPIDHRGKA
ncbi:MAG: sensor histidine kinase [Lachnospiraceae bacterium]|nr:sensor histidine kinase [Lachnospiraceae bacterium]